MKIPVALAPKYLNNLRLGVTLSLDKLLCKYHSDMKGIPIAYKDVKLADKYGQLLEEDVTIRFYVKVEVFWDMLCEISVTIVST